MKSTHKLLQEQERRFNDIISNHNTAMQVVDGCTALALSSLKTHITWARLSGDESEHVINAVNNLTEMVLKLQEINSK